MTLTPLLIFSAGVLLMARAAPRWALGRPALMGVLTTALVLLGVVCLGRLPRELMPNAAADTVTVSVSVRGGMSPADVEALIVRPLEDALGDAPRLKSIFASAKKDRGVVSVTFHPGADMQRVTAEVSERVDRATSRLPPEIEKPVIAHYEENDAPVYIAAITSDRLSPEDIRRLVDENIKDRLLRVPGVANVEVGGGREDKILVELDAARLSAYGLSPQKVTALLGRRNVAAQAGSVTGESRVAPVRIVGSFKGLEDIRRVVVGRDPGGASVLLGQVATVRDSYLEPESLSRLNGRAAVSLYIQKESSANTIQVVGDLREAIDRAWKELPAGRREGLEWVVVSNQAVGILSAIGSVRSSLIGGILLILLALAVSISEKPRTRRLAGAALAFLLLALGATAVFRWNPAWMEPLYTALLALACLIAVFEPDFRPGFLVAGSMPLSIFFCFILFWASGVTLNAMSLFGLALGIGMLVDNATVVFERIAASGPLSPGPEGRARALAAAEEVRTPLIGGTVTNAIVFVPFFFLSHDLRMIYMDVAAAVGASLFASIAISLTTVPLLATTLRLTGEARWPAFLKRVGEYPPLLRLGRWVDHLLIQAETWGRLILSRILTPAPPPVSGERVGLKRRLKSLLDRARHPAISGLKLWEGLALFALLFAGLWVAGGRGWAKWLFAATGLGVTGAGLGLFGCYSLRWPGLIRHRWNVLAAALVLATAGAATIFWATERDFQTGGQTDEFVIFVELSSGVKLDISSHVIREVEAVLTKDPEIAPAIKTAVSRIEGWSSKVYVTLVPRTDRRLTTEQVQSLLREKLKDAGRDKDGNAFVHFSSPRQGQEIAVQIAGPQYEALETLAGNVTGALEKIPGLSDVKMRYRPGRPEVLAVVDTDRAALAGLSAEDVAEAAHALLRGLRATVYRAAGRQTETIVRLRQEDRANLDQLADMPLLTRQGRPARLGDVADLKMSRMSNEIYREDKERLIQVTANREGLPLGRAARLIQDALDRLAFPVGYRASVEGGVREMTQSLHQLAAGVVVMVVLVYLTLVLIFESWVEPFIIMSAVPLCLIGVGTGLALFRLPLTTGVMVGLMMLAGVVVNNSIMLVDHLNQHTPPALPLSERLLMAVRGRTRAIFLTTGTNLLGFLPMMLDFTEGGALWRPLAVTLVFGLLTATVLTLYVTPVLTYIVLGGGKPRKTQLSGEIPSPPGRRWSEGPDEGSPLR